MHGWNGYGYGMGFMGIWWLLGTALIVALIWVMVRSGRGPGRDRPEDVLKRRYANGEIDRDTYRKMLHDLHGES